MKKINNYFGKELQAIKASMTGGQRYIKILFVDAAFILLSILVSFMISGLLAFITRLFPDFEMIMNTPIEQLQATLDVGQALASSKAGLFLVIITLMAGFILMLALTGFFSSLSLFIAQKTKPSKKLLQQGLILGSVWIGLTQLLLFGISAITKLNAFIIMIVGLISIFYFALAVLNLAKTKDILLAVQKSFQTRVLYYLASIGLFVLVFIVLNMLAYPLQFLSFFGIVLTVIIFETFIIWSRVYLAEIHKK
ncbi:hypothetical protein GOV04_00620 [Candidatus Woesearchaeota archaeon]|nr:hypothetical protein [Candidatus Woesearchaeota archaeon]